MVRAMSNERDNETSGIGDIDMWRSLFSSRRKREREIREEIDLHLRMATRDRVERGASPVRARQDADKEFGNVALVREATRGIWSWRWLDQLRQDTSFGFRQLSRNKTLTLLVVAMIALGIGANTAVFTHMNAVLFETLPVEEASDLRFLEWTSPDREFPTRRLWDGRTTDASGSRVYSGFPYPTYRYLRDRSSSFEDFVCFGLARVNLGSGQGAERVSAEFVSENYFDTLGLTTVVGRPFGSEDAQSGRPVAVISHGLWQRRFGGTNDMSETVVRINGSPFQVLGVAPAGFSGLDPAEDAGIFLPLAAMRSGRIDG